MMLIIENSVRQAAAALCQVAPLSFVSLHETIGGADPDLARLHRRGSEGVNALRSAARVVSFAFLGAELLVLRRLRIGLSFLSRLTSSLHVAVGEVSTELRPVSRHRGSQQNWVP